MKKFLLRMFTCCLIICGCLFINTQFDSIYATDQITPQVGCGDSHTIALKDDGTVWVWGYNYHGQLGDGTNEPTTIPKQLETISNVKAIAAGLFHNLALKTDGTVWAWGANHIYQLADGTTIDRNTPVQVSGLDNVKALAAGENHSLALKEDGTVWEWGGWGTTTPYRSIPGIVPGLTDVTAIAASLDYSFALKSDGTLWGWGCNTSAQLGVGASDYISTPTQVFGVSGVKAIACGFKSVYAITNDGALWVWGDNSRGELGLGWSSQNITPSYIGIPTKNPTLSNLVAVAARGYFAVAQKGDGTIWAWGDNEWGQLGDGTTVRKTNPTRISSLSNIFSITCGAAHTFAVKNNGSLYAWGANGFGQLGNGTYTDQYAPAQMLNFSLISMQIALTATVGDGQVSLTWGRVLGAKYNVKRSEITGGPYTTIASNIDTTTYTDTTVTSNGTTYYYIVTAVTIDGENTVGNEVSATPCKVIPQVAGGYSHSLALMSDSTLWVWGRNNCGQLGDNAKLTINTCERLENFSDVQAVAASDYHSIALKVGGTVWAWGENNYGQLGDGTTVERCAPVQVANISAVKKITTGQYFSAALKTDGTVWTWGTNGSGQLGDGTTISRTTPVQVLGLTNIISIAAGDDYAFALKDDGTLWAWGRNENGEISGRTTSYEATPVQITTVTGVKAVACGYNAVYAIKLDGTLWAWGDDTFGQKGDGTNNGSGPVQVSGLSNVIAVSAGACFAVALLSDGTVRAWGRNDYGQLGDGTTVNKNTPTQVIGLDNILTIGCGNFHALAYKKDGSVYAWGENSSGQLGDGTNTCKVTPVKVPNVGLLSLPAAPLNLTAIVGNTKVVLTWKVATGAVSYNVKRAETSGGPYMTIASIGNVTTTTFTDTAVTNDTTYYYIVTSVNRDGEIGGGEVSATPNANKPLAPANLTAQPGYTKVILSWDPVAGAYTYNVKRSDYWGGPYSTVVSNLTQTTFTDTGLTDGKQYFYIVTAVNDNGEGPSSSVVSVIPVVPPPSNLTATAGNGKVTLRWTKGDITWTRIKRATTAGGPYVSLMSTTGSSYDDKDVTIGTTYYYIVVNTASSEESTPSNEVSAAPYAAPYNLTATAGDRLVTLTWGAATGATYYSVKRSTTAGGPYITLVTDVSGTTYNDTTVINNTLYYYVVTTVSAGAERFSNEVSATPRQPEASEPNDTLASASSISNNITISATIGSSTDLDYYMFTISSTKTCTITLTPPSSKDYDLYLLSSSGSQIGSSTNGSGSVDSITKTLAAGTYYIRVKGYGGAYSTTLTYTLRVVSN